MRLKLVFKTCFFIESSIIQIFLQKIQVDDDSSIFDESIFKSCFNLRLLSLKSYSLRKLGAHKLAKLGKLDTLILANVKLKFVDEYAFAGLENSLVELNLNSNALEWIPTSALERLKRLKRLSLAQNQIKRVHSNAFFRVTSTLNTLDLSYNYLSQIDENAFNGPVQNSLKYLHMQNNELKWHQFIHLLYNLHLLQEVNVDFNKLGTLSPADSFLKAVDQTWVIAKYTNSNVTNLFVFELAMSCSMH